MQTGAKLSVAVTAPIVAIGVQSYKAAIQSREAFAQVEQALKTMGSASGKTAKELQKSAKALETFSNFDDDDILQKVTANLLTFGNVSGDVFDRAQQAAVDLSARLGQDLQSSAIQLGKALNDPVKGITALSRVGVSFTAEQKKMIEAMVEAGNTAGAQRLILAELEKQYGGAAKAAREAAPGGDLQQQWRTFQEIVGERLVQAFERLEAAIAPILKSFNELSPTMQTAIVVVGALAAALGPLLIAVGFAVSGLAPFLATIKVIGASGGVVVAAKAALAGLATAFWPLAAAALAVYVAWKNWDTIAPILVELGQQFRAFGEGLGIVEANANASAEEIEKFRRMRQLGEDVRSFADGMDELDQSLRDLNRSAAEAGTATREALISAWQAFEGWWDRTQANANALVDMFKALPGIVIDALRRLVAGVQEWMGAKLTAAFDGAKKKIQEVGGWFYDLYDKVVGNSYVPDMVNEIGQQMRRLEVEMVQPAKGAAKKTADIFRELQAEVSSILARLFPEVEKAMTFEREMKALEAYHRAGKLSAAQHAAAVEALKREYAGLHRDIAGAEAGGEFERIMMTADGKTIEQMNSEAAGRFSDVMERMRRDSNATRVQVVQSFKDMADSALAAFDRMANAIKRGGFLGILESVIGFGLQLGSMGVFGKSFQTKLNTPLQPRALGGPVTAGKPYLVGERGPEIVVPGMSGSVISNRDLANIGGGGNTYHFSGNLLTPEWWAQISAMNASAARAGAGLAMQQTMRSRQWSLG